MVLFAFIFVLRHYAHDHTHRPSHKVIRQKPAKFGGRIPGIDIYNLHHRLDGNAVGFGHRISVRL